MTRNELRKFWKEYKDFNVEPSWMPKIVDRIADAVSKKAALNWKCIDEFDIFVDIYRLTKLDFLDAIVEAVPWVDLRVAMKYAEEQTQIFCMKYYEAKGARH